MGQTVSSVVDSLEKNSDKEKLANDALNSLTELARLQEETFYQRVSNPSFDTNLIQIKKIISHDKLVQANVSTEPADIGGLIKDSFQAFASGEIADGISKVVAGGLKVLLGSYEGSKSTRQIYLITAGKIGGLHRFDLNFFAYRFASEQLTSVTKEVVAVSIVHSSVDVRSLDENTLRVIVENVYGAVDEDLQEKIFDKLKSRMDNELARLSMEGHLKESTRSLRASLASAGLTRSQGINGAGESSGSGGKGRAA